MGNEKKDMEKEWLLVRFVSNNLHCYVAKTHGTCDEIVKEFIACVKDDKRCDEASWESGTIRENEVPTVENYVWAIAEFKSYYVLYEAYALDKIKYHFLGGDYAPEERWYKFKCFINSKCSGIMDIFAIDEEEAYQKAKECMAEKLTKAFPTFDIDYDVTLLDSLDSAEATEEEN